MASLSLMSDTGFALGTDDPKEARSTLKTNVENYNTTVGVLNSGTIGQVLTSQGAGNQPVFTSVGSTGGECLLVVGMPLMADVTGDGTLVTVTNWDTAARNVDGSFDSVSGVYTVPISGIYSIVNDFGLHTDSTESGLVGFLIVSRDATDTLMQTYVHFTPMVGSLRFAETSCHYTGYLSQGSVISWKFGCFGSTLKDVSLGNRSRVAIFRYPT